MAESKRSVELLRGDQPSPLHNELLAKLFRRISEVSTLPGAAQQIIAVASDPAAEVRDLLEAVENDPALAVRIMRAVNSAYYSLAHPVDNLHHAVTLLGFGEVRNLAVTIYVSELFRGSPGHGRYTREGLWGHSVAVATASRAIARLQGRASRGEAYLAGLMHDLGLILEDQHLHGPFCEVIDALSDDCPTCEVEFDQLGFDHASLGQYVAGQWRFAPAVCDAIGHHHRADEYDGPHGHVVRIVAVANFLCTARGLSSTGFTNVVMPSKDVFVSLGLEKPQLAAICEELDAVIDQAGALAVV